ncbi:T9SS type A sorting domain-containing protein [candidate division WOR-3 bacterium]|nr:T9SS type A sorting domain-containing protein [candidate division WOR-3 bacterium]
MFKSGIALVFTFFTLPLLAIDVELIYDDGEPDGSVTWQEGVIAAVRMSAPEGTWKLKGASYYLYGGKGKIRVFADEAGFPGNDIIEALPVSYEEEPDWYYVDLTEFDIIITGDFYVGVEVLEGINLIRLGHDFLDGGNGRTWNYVPQGGWIQDPDYTLFIRATVTNEVGVEDELTPEPAIWTAIPGVISNSTVLNYTLQGSGNVKIEIYDACGRCVHILVDGYQTKGYHNIQWNVKSLPTGVYFVCLTVGDCHRVDKIAFIR